MKGSVGWGKDCDFFGWEDDFVVEIGCKEGVEKGGYVMVGVVGCGFEFFGDVYDWVGYLDEVFVLFNVFYDDGVVVGEVRC